MHHEDFSPSRRQFLLAGGATAAGGLILPQIAMGRGAHERTLTLYNTHNGEWFKGTYWAEGRYLNESLEKIAHLLRDRRNDKVKQIDPKLLDLLNAIHAKMGGHGQPFEIICGYRSPETNRLLHKKSRGVAKNSFHIKGQAVDIRVPKVQLAKLRDVAKSFRAGGVGYYPRSGFVHVDFRGFPVHW
ncbi:MAG: YcbK family protein [Holosporales bacterium]